MSTPALAPRILVITGEASGDRYGALLVRAVAARFPAASFHGIGGERMRKAGVELLFEADRIAVTGIVEVAGAFGAVLAAWRAARRHLRERRPDLVLLIDYPDFNLRFARHARRAGVPVAYFVGPQVWAWRRYRVRQIARDVTRMLVILPFEERFYAEHGVPVRFVGHPLVDLTGRPRSRQEAATALGLPAASPVLGLLPGSRRNEVRELLPTMLQAAAALGARHPGLRCVLPVATTLRRQTFAEAAAASPVPVRLVEDGFEGAVSACHVALVASGTATLETALLGVPPVIAYRLRPWTYRLARWMSSLDHVGLPNLVLGRRAVPECIQDECRPETLAAAAEPLLGDTPERRAALSSLDEIRAALGGGGAVERAADELTEMLRGRPAVAASVP